MTAPTLSAQFDALPEYAFPRLRALLGDAPPGGDGPPVMMSIGEPKHPPPPFVLAELARGAADYGRYPPIEGIPALREAIAGWLGRRYGAAAAMVDPDRHILPLNGTREGLFIAAQVAIPRSDSALRPAMLMPNPFYQCYAAAALAAGAEPVYLPATAETGHLPDFEALDPALLRRTALVYLCSPANPQGAAASLAYLTRLLALAEEYDFIVGVDECYSDIYSDAPPVGVLEAVAAAGVDMARVMAFHSLSKRSNLAGLRSGFVVGGEKIIAALRRLRSYAGPTTPIPAQRAAALAWADDVHAAENRALYAEKFAAADAILGDLPGYRRPDGGFFLWSPVGDAEAATVRLWREYGVRALPGPYLARDDARFLDGANPGAGYLRVALVEPLAAVRRG